ncbi:MAG: hypothetical protein LBB61_03310 [Treponema sp.]|jgi:hypothetical protein|nr:hypothetical protein [Treponema sp.]
MDTPNPASYGDGNNDDILSINAGVSIGDTAALEPRYNGQLRMNGQMTYGGIQPSMVDDTDLKITERVSHTDTVEITEQAPPMDREKNESDVYPSGLRYDGRIKYDHGQVLRFDGEGTYGGAWKYCNIIPRKGTVIDEIHGDILNPASYSGTSDTDDIKAHLALQDLEDRAAIRPTYNGLFKYQGRILHDDGLSSLPYRGIKPPWGVDESPQLRKVYSEPPGACGKGRFDDLAPLPYRGIKPAGGQGALRYLSTAALQGH